MRAEKVKIKSVFCLGEAFKPSGGTKGGESIEKDAALISQLKQLAYAAFTACGAWFFCNNNLFKQ